ncbi:MAG TPA: sugar ABC transporter ATP-binding protein [Candidatus Limnocylindria bacterium]|nr:sugar ABC transporter ATP-binding protein [Candidatus Limnocylindria bacterium]
MQISMEQVVVDFGPVRAVDHVDITVRSGEIVGLLGENGAGKSSLMNVLAGTFPPTGGRILLDGKPVRMGNALQAMRHGIRFIHQELNLCNDLRVFENMYLAQEILGPGGLLDKKQMAARTAEVFSRMNIEIDPWTVVGDLQIAEKQLVEIARALLFKCDLIIMDEPTSALSTREVSNLFAIMRQLRDQGVGFIYISHKMPEIFEICERYYVLRDGKLVGQGSIADTDEKVITELMIGRALANDDFHDKPVHTTGTVAMRARGISGENFHDISFDVHKGEILVFTGLQSSGRDQLADALFGVIPHTGSIEMGGLPLHGTIRSRMRKGLAMVPRNRKERGIHNDLSILDNVSMGFFNTRMRSLLIQPKAEKARYMRQKAALAIRADNPRNLITSLSGGNQQKIILGRWLETGADVLIFDNPTQGIDVGTKFEIYHLLIRLAEQGKALLIFSSEFPEIIKVADRCIVMYKGRINKEIPRAQLTEEDLMYYSTGSNLEMEGAVGTEETGKEGLKHE